MCYVGPVGKLCSCILVLVVVGVVVFGFVWLGNHEHQHSSSGMAQGESSPASPLSPPSCGNVSIINSTGTDTVTSNGCLSPPAQPNLKPLTSAPPPFGGRPFLSALAPVHL